MYIPLNKIHWYVAIPIVLFIGVRGLVQYKKDRNRLNLYVGWVGLLYTACFVSYGIPLLLTSNPDIISSSILLGDILQFMALFTIWLGVIRVYLTKNNQLSKFAVFLNILFLIISIIVSLFNANGSSVQLNQTSSGFIEIILPTSFWFELIIAIEYIGFVLFGAYFIYGARQNKDINKKIRMYSIAFILTTIGLLYVIQPFFDAPNNSQLATNIIAAVLLVSGIIIVASIYLKRKKV